MKAVLSALIVGTLTLQAAQAFQGSIGGVSTIKLRLVTHQDSITASSDEAQGRMRQAQEMIARTTELARNDSRFEGLQLLATPVYVGGEFARNTFEVAYTTDSTFWLKTKTLSERCRDAAARESFAAKVKELEKDATVIAIGKLSESSGLSGRTFCTVRYMQFSVNQ